MTARAPFRVFYSYSHADRKLLAKLLKHMAMLRREGLITEWYDHDIEAGSQWRDEIERELEAADVILLLVSADFLASDFAYEQEMMRAVERADAGEALVIPVMLRRVEGWKSTPFARFQVVPRGAKPISKWSDPDEGYTDAVQRIRAALEDLAPKPVAIPASEPVDEERLSATEIALLAKIEDPQQRRRQRDEMLARKETMLGTALANLDAMRQDMLKKVQRNLEEPDS